MPKQSKYFTSSVVQVQSHGFGNYQLKSSELRKFAADCGTWGVEGNGTKFGKCGRLSLKCSLVCESEIRVIACLLRCFHSSTGKEDCRVIVFLILFNIGGERPLSEALTVQIFPTLAFFVLVKSVYSSYDSATLQRGKLFKTD